MKTTNIINNIANKNVSLEITIALPYKGEPVRINLEKRSELLIALIAQFSKHMVKALEARMEACANNLVLHMDDIMFNDGIRIVYKRKDGTSHSFNVPSYQAMNEAVATLRKAEYKKFCQNPGFIDQTLKALYWVEKPEDESGKFKYSDLISALTDIHAVGCPDL